MWKTLAASVVGSAHIQQNKGNEDAFAVGSSLSKNLILVASDGAGSATCAAQGSAFVSQKMLELFAQMPFYRSRVGLECELLAALYVLKAELRLFAESQERDVKDFAATLLAVKITPPFVLAIQIGDGAIVTQCKDGLHFLTQPFHGSYASETVFVSSDDALQKASVAVMASDAIQALALMTDGLEPVALSKGKPFKDFFTPLFAFCANEKAAHKKCHDLTNFLSGGQLATRTHDDKTLILSTLNKEAKQENSAEQNGAET